ncbi:spore germination protein [Paenibacillus sp. MBLB2552]|uniref:Spore germination protein n=1 Tax=Paenibacillus mellifer TaxID=2937794 RepID=A0A9X1Y752_9BACL|nr:GerAB/ArcD/ProY family transporter [Paenibacillus mellifer]MCK8488392.1 spore germination protein [Paenibacillus mellifer]
MNFAKSRLPEFIASFALFEVGSTTLFQIGAEAKQDAWLVMLVAALAGLLLLLMHLFIHRLDPKRDLYELCLTYFGKVAGMFFGSIFAAYFAYEASRNLRDLGELASYVLLNRTPIGIIILIAALVIANSVRYGAKVVFLSCLVMIPFIIVSYFVLISMIAGVGLIHFENMLPGMENGVLPVLKNVPDVIAFPFGQTVLFLVFFPMIHQQKNMRRAVLVTYGLTAIFLILVNQMNVLVLGPKLAETVTFPLLQSVQLIELVEVFERMDILFVLVLFIGLGTKLVLFYIGAVAGGSRITGTPYKKWVIPFGIAIFGMSFISPNFTHHLWVGIDVVLKWYPIIQIGLPVILMILMLVRKNKRGSDVAS